MNMAWEKFKSSRFRSRTPRVFYVADHENKRMLRFGSYKTNKAKWAKQ